MKKTNVILSIFRGILFALAVTVIGVASLALFAKDAEGSFISIISVIIKVLSIAVGTIVSAIKIRKRGVLVGVTVAVVYWILCILLSLLIEPFQFSLKLLLDLLFTALIGAFSGILTVNTLK